MCTNDERNDKMIPSSRETKFPTKEESEKKTRASSSATPWLKSKDPRVVRVSSAFGGKDRHSKVCTIRGLRDRRVRLSVPTAIQLYDLQDRLGLNQPSKVVDWLLNAAKDEIDELPPLQIPQGSFINGNGINWEDFSNSFAPTRSKSKEDEEDEEDQEVIDTNNNTNINSTTYGAQVSSSNNIFQRNNNQSSLQGLFSSSPMPHGSYYQLDPSIFNFSQQTNHHHHHHQEHQNLNAFPFQSTLSLPSRSTHVLVYPQGATQTYFPSYTPSSTAAEFDHSRQNNHFPMLSSSTSSSSQNLMSSSLTSPSFLLSQSMKPFQLSMTPMHIDAKNNDSTRRPK